MLTHYENLATNYHLNREQFDISDLFEEFYHQIQCPSSGLLLDLGCGAGDGFPSYFLQKGWQVEGVDFSAKMLELCHQHHPEIKTKHCDMQQLDIKANHYDIIESIYAIFHLPNEVQAQLLKKSYNGLKEGGYIYFTYATKEYTGSPRYEGTVSFMGTPLFYAHLEPESLQAKLQNIGFKNIIFSQKEVGGEAFLWVLAQKPTASD